MKSWENNAKKHKRKKFRAVTSFIVIVSMILLFFIHMHFQLNEKKKGALGSAEILLNQVQDILKNNEEDEKSLEGSLKEDYIIRARAASYIVENIPETANNIGELKKIAAFLQIDELHLFDTKGYIYGGTNPEYYGYNFNSGEQMRFFKPMLKDETLSLCQDVTPNTAESKPMMYAIVWREDKKGMVQIGLEPTRLLEEMRKNEISYLAENMPVLNGMTIYIADGNTGEVLGCTEEIQVGKSLKELGWDPSLADSADVMRFSANIMGKPSYCVFQQWGGYCIGVTQLRSEVNSDLRFEGIILLVYLSVVAFVLILIIWKSTDMIELERETRVHEQEIQNERLSDALEKAEVASKAKSTFLFNMSHDIRTPMNAILGYARLAKKHISEEKQMERYLNNIEVSGEQLLGLINSVLDMSRIESGKVVLNEEVCSAYSLFDEVLVTVKEEVLRKNLTVDVVRKYTDQYIYCDKVRTQEIFLNLLSNSIKYTNPGGMICVTFDKYPLQGDEFCFVTTVEDNGIGMGEEFLSHIFESFERERTATVSGIRGTGLGMSITKRLVDLMNGTIQVESCLGKGTKVTVKIPCRIAELPDAVDEKCDKRKNFNFGGKRILLAEDNDLNAEIAMEILKETGVSIERAEDGTVCVEKLKQSRNGYYDLILMDIQMPLMDGYTATKTIRALTEPEKANIPIIAMTANAFEEDRKQAISCGMNGHIAKPIDVEKLFETLEEIFKKKK